MKIVIEGDRSWRNWWVGQKLTCKTCGQQVQLDEWDRGGHEWIDEHPNVVSFRCTNCRDIMRLEMARRGA